MNLKFRATLMVTLWLAAAPAAALEPGDPAPPLSVKHWVLGPAVDGVGRPADAVTVIAFWATWSKPATESLLVLSKVQEQLGDKVVIAAIADSPLEDVEQVIKTNTEFRRLRIRVGVDDDQKTTLAYMRDAGRSGLPHAFVADRQGVVVWDGHPGDLKEVLDQVIAGTFKIADAQTPAGNDIDPDLGAELNQAVASENWRGAVEVIDRIMRRHPDSAALDQLMGTKFVLLYERLQDYAAARAFAQELLNRHPDKARALNNVAWTLLARGDFETLKHRWPDIAHEAARKAHEATEGQDAAILDTYARSLYLLGDVAKAVDTQRSAVSRFRADIDRESDLDTVRRMNDALQDMEEALTYYEDVRDLRTASRR